MLDFVFVDDLRHLLHIAQYGDAGNDASGIFGRFTHDSDEVERRLRVVAQRFGDLFGIASRPDENGSRTNRLETQAIRLFQDAYTDAERDDENPVDEEHADGNEKPLRSLDVIHIGTDDETHGDERNLRDAQSQQNAPNVGYRYKTPRRPRRAKEIKPQKLAQCDEWQTNQGTQKPLPIE